ncbi:MAG TPA: SDR family oxidoreductase [Steroidobacteraceae bacterium]|nr:SDR family oxidoreductase [Steroidobacteraceae bacterium]
MTTTATTPNDRPDHVVIVGGTSGIGLATARHAEARRGARVTVAGRTRDHLDAAREELSSGAGFEQVDATDPQSVAALFARVGRLDHLVVSLAGGAALGPFRELDAEALAATLDVKLFGYLNVIRHAVPQLDARGSITLVTGMAAQRPAPGIASLAIANGAIEALVGVLALELKPVRVNAVSPGVIRTPAWDRLPGTARNALFENTARRTPVGRVGEADEVAAAILSLIDNDFLTGVVLPCDGGMGVAGGG